MVRESAPRTLILRCGYAVPRSPGRVALSISGDEPARQLVDAHDALVPRAAQIASQLEVEQAGHGHGLPGKITQREQEVSTRKQVSCTRALKIAPVGAARRDAIPAACAA